MKKIIVLVFFVSIFSISIDKAQATALTSVTNVPWSSDVSVNGKHTINFTTASTIPADGKIVITYPSGFNVSGTTFNSWSSLDGGQSIGIAGQVITITRDNTGTSATAGAKYIVLNNITNNSSAVSNYNITVETRDSSNATLDGPTTSANFSATATDDGLNATFPWPMRGYDNRNSFSSASAAPDYPTLAWKFTFADNDYHDGPVEDSNGIVYIVGTSNIYALNTDGTTKWSVAQGHSTAAGTILTKNNRIVIWYRAGYLESRNISDGSLVWGYTTPIDTDAGSLSIGPDGSIFVSNRSGGIEAINSDGTRKFYNSTTDNRDSTPAVDNATGQIYTFSEGTVIGYNPDGTIKWSVGGSSVGNPAQLNSSGSVVCGEGRNTTNNTSCFNTSDGSTLWSASNASTGYGQGAFSPDGSIYYTMYNAASVSARNITTGTANWTQAYTGGFGYAGGGNLIVDANNRVYAGQQAFNSDGTNRWTLLSTGTPIPIIGTSNTMVYYDRLGNLYDYKPWTLSLTTDKSYYKAGATVNLTATSSMLQTDPASLNNNLVQVIMPNGDKVILTYSSTSAGNTLWVGSYVLPSNITEGIKSITVQAAAYNVVTGTVTTFDSLPSGFNNTGITNTATFNVDNTAPTVSAGLDQNNINEFTQTGSVSDNGSIDSYLWSVTSKPDSSTVSFGSPSALSTVVSTSAELGTFVIRLSATDKAGNSGYGEFTLIKLRQFYGRISTASVSIVTNTTTTSLPSSPPPFVVCAPGDKFNSATGIPCPAHSFIIRTLMLTIPHMKGDDVKTLQFYLNRHKYALPELVPDGIFGLKTKSAVINLQKANHLVLDGIVGPITANVLDNTPKGN